MSTLVKSTLALSAALLIGRLLGFLREVLLAARLGVSAEADVAVLILTLPDFLIAILLAGGFGAALVPALRRVEGVERLALFRFATTCAFLVACVVALLVFALPETLFRVLAPALSYSAFEAHLVAVQLTALSIPLAALAGALGALLNARNTFFVVGLGTGAYNFVLCAVLLGLPAEMSLILPLALGVLAAATTRVVMLFISARPPVVPLFSPPTGASLQLLRLFGAGVLAVGITAGAHILFRTIAGLAEPGALTAFAYALKLFLLPVMILFAPLATVLLPRLTDSGDSTEIAEEGLSVVIILAAATLAVGICSGDAIARLIFFRGAMSAEGLAALTFTAQMMFLALPFAALELIGAASLNARKRTGRVMVHGVVALALGGGFALFRPDLVMVGFFLFYATVALLHVSHLPVRPTVVFAMFSPMRVLLAVALIAFVYAADELWIPSAWIWIRAAAGALLFLGIAAIWKDRLVAFGKMR